MQIGNDHKSPVIVRMDDRGRVVLPQIIRESLKVGPGDALYVRVDEHGVRFGKISPPPDENVPESEWLKVAARLETYGFLADEDDLYTWEDGPDADET